MIGILAPVLVFSLVNTTVLYRQALKAADTAYDRTLLATAKSIGDLLEVSLEADRPHLKSTLLYSALEAFEADNRSRLYYRVTGFDGEIVSGFDALPAWHGRIPQKGPYAALVDFYDDHYRGTPVRVAVLLQPVTWAGGQGMATIQVAETLELRETLARSLLLDTLWRQAALLLLIAGVVVFVVQRATRPVQDLSLALRSRAEGDLAPLDDSGVPRELQPLVAATNHLMGRLSRLLDHQTRFVRDASHQLRTPLAVLKTQVQSAQRGDLEPQQALGEIGDTVDRATTLANQMLALAKVEQVRQQADAPVLDWAEIVRAVALDLSALIVEHQLDFDIDTQPAPVRGHEWALRELSRNLIHNAIKHGRDGGRLAIHLVTDARHAALTVSDSGMGITDEQRHRLFQPFSAGLGAGNARGGSGLGLAICHEIVSTLGGQIELDNRIVRGAVEGLDATVRLPLATTPK
ncbi:sensor histidine kinase [Ideonella sp.]|uniref:sensor histidine kinase n=1 Tax=Ideonella sp. TaxID=1929293 RepID=UPI002B49EE91|nr:sensor histidine kinase [Ideonella sp.]HJV72435.1 sensor histidine kinase [Ideonella sp.]